MAKNMRVYAMYAGLATSGNSNAAAYVDIKANGIIVACHLSLQDLTGGNGQKSIVEVSRQTTIQYNVNDAQGLIYWLAHGVLLTTSGAVEAWPQSNIEGLALPVFLYDRIYMHLSVDSSRQIYGFARIYVLE